MNPPKKPAAIPPSIHVAIQTRRGHTYRYRARDLRLALYKGIVRVIEKDGGCFVFFDVAPQAEKPNR